MEKKLIEVEVTFKSEENGGRPQLPEGSGYSPHFIAKSGTMLGVVFVDFPEEAKFGEVVKCKVGLLYHPNEMYDELIGGTDFQIVEGAKVVGNGVVS